MAHKVGTQGGGPGQAHRMEEWSQRSRTPEGPCPSPQATFLQVVTGGDRRYLCHQPGTPMMRSYRKLWGEGSGLKPAPSAWPSATASKGRTLQGR